MNFYKLIQGDCLEVLPTINRKSVDCIIADPPYSTPVITAYGRKKEKNYGDLSIQKHFFRGLRDEAKRVLKDQCPLFIFCDSKYYPILHQVFYEWGTSQLLVWDKRRIGMGSPFRKQYELIYFLSPDTALHFKNNMHLADILKYKPVLPEKRLMGSQKPISLVNDLIKAFTDENDIILDPFLGSGTTMESCQNLRRSCIGIEIDSEHCEIIKKRCFSRTFLDREVKYEFLNSLLKENL